MVDSQPLFLLRKWLIRWLFSQFLRHNITTASYFCFFCSSNDFESFSSFTTLTKTFYIIRRNTQY
ncbi:Uncharacterised protein [Vibrio cholerae]|nr:Uncharacterised protein [Vibrio cholerae]